MTSRASADPSDGATVLLLIAHLLVRLLSLYAIEPTDIH